MPGGRWRCLAMWVVATLAVLPILAQDPAQPGESEGPSIVYLTASTAYANIGREDGLAEGDTIEIVRDGVVVASLRVSHLSSHRASFELGDSSQGIRVGDQVRFTPHRPIGDAAESATNSSPDAKPRRRGGGLARAGLRGRVGIRYLSIRDRTDTGSDLSQPALDLRLDGNRIGGGPMDLAIDVRGRRTYTAASDGATSRDDITRVYRMSLSFHADGPGMTLTGGRQYSPTLSAVSVFDGLLLDFTNERRSFGLFSGTQPDPIDYGYSDEIREHGVYGELHSRPGSRRNWAVALGGVGSYVGSEINREFLFLQTRYNSPRLYIYLSQEIDHNRDWKLEYDDSSISPTSTLFNIGVRASRVVTLRAGYDSRHRIRLYRDRVTPETEFDDANRLGARAGLTFQSRVHFRVALDARTNGGENAGEAKSYTLTFGALSFSRQNVGFTMRVTRYTNERVEGQLYSASIGTNLGRRVRLQVGGGLRDEIPVGLLVTPSNLTWISADLDVNLGRHWYLLLAAERTTSEIEEAQQYYSSLTYRF